MSVRNTGTPKSLLARNAFIENIRNKAAAAKISNPQDNAVLASPPTISTTTASSATAGLTKAYRIFNGSNLNLTNFYTAGGAPVVMYNAYAAFQCVTYPSGGNIGSGKHSTAWAVEFMTDSPKFDLALGQGAYGFRLIVDGQYVSRTPTTGLSGSMPTFRTVDFTSAGGRKARRIRVEGTLDLGFCGVNVAPTDRVWKPEANDVVRCSIFGDSITAATGTSFTSDGWPFVMGQMLGWEVTSASIGSTGYVTPGTYWKVADHLAADLALEPYDVIAFAAGINDGGQSTATITANALACFQTARATYPFAPIIVFGSFGGSTGPSATWIGVENAIAAAVTSLGDPNTYFVPINTAPTPWIYGTGYVNAPQNNGNSDFYTGATNGSDNTHPTPVGHLYLGRVAAQAVRDLVIPNLRA